jgi:dienelactone hydrolase
MPKQYYDISDEIEKLKKDISEQLADKYIDKLEILCQKYFDMNDIDVEESFVAGYSLGTQLTAEAFDNKI